MKLIDRIGIAANQMDKRLLHLLKDVEVVDFEDCYSGEKNLSKTIVIGEETSLPMIFRFMEEAGLCFLIQKKHEYFLYNLIMSAMICKYPDVFLKSPITVITRNASINDRTITIPFTSTADKQRIMFEVEEFVGQNSNNSSIKQNIRIIISEMFSNAMYSAPTDQSGNYLFSTQPRNAEVTYPNGDKGEILLSFNNEIFAIACRDPYGSVNKVRVTKRLHQVFHDSKLASVEHRANENLGSGLGLKMIIENSIGFGMVVRQGFETLVYATLPVGSGNRKVTRIAKNICFNFY
jgi:hypothetical protein